MHGILRRIAIIAALAVLIAGCGQKGPLYLPDSPRDSDDEQQSRSGGLPGRAA